MKQNEIRDFIERAPKSFVFNGVRSIDLRGVRKVWLAEISAGDIDARINRRAGIGSHRPLYKPNPVFAAVRRHHRNALRKIGIRICY